MTDNSKILNLRNFDIVLINFVEESKKDELLKELKELYGEYQPLEIKVGSGLAAESIAPPNVIFRSKILYYDAVNNLRKPLPDKFQSLEIRVINYITSWCVVICSVRLKQEYLEKAKQEFEDKLRQHNVVANSDILEKSHQEIESFLSPYIMDNIISKKNTNNRMFYPFLHLGEVGELPSQNVMDIIRDTDNTRIGMGWRGLGWGSVLERKYLVGRRGRRNQGLILITHGFSILNLAPTQEGKTPDSWSKDTRREFRALRFENSIIDNVSLLLLSYIVLSYRLERIKDLERTNVALSHEIQELLDQGSSRDYLEHIASLQKELERHRSQFISMSFDMRNENDELSDIMSCTREFLESRDFQNSSIEEPFFHPIGADTWQVENHVRTGHPKQGVLIKMVIDSEFKREQLLKGLARIEEGQIKLSDYVRDILGISLQKRTDRLTNRIVRLTWALIGLAIVQVVLIIVQIVIAATNNVESIPK